MQRKRRHQTNAERFLRPCWPVWLRKKSSTYKDNPHRPYCLMRLRVPHGSEYLHHHHVHEGLGVFPVPWSSRWSWSLYLFLGCPFGLYFSACFGSLFMPILCTCCSHFSWYCFISFTVFSAPVFSLIHWFFSEYLNLHKEGIVNLKTVRVCELG